jgi:protoporphyrinogen oxidase
MISSPPSSLIVIGAGPAGLTAGYEAVKKKLHPIIIEMSNQVGGIARTEFHRGYRFDIGGHRFFTHFEEIQRIWKEVLNTDFLTVNRISRIYYKNRFYKYPLSFFNALSNLGVLEGVLILLSYFKAKVFPIKQEENLEQWVTNRFGQRLYQTFFRTYTEKVWGIPCSSIQADWAAQRIKGLSLKSVLYDALVRGRKNSAKSLIREFHYPVHGPGMMWQCMQKKIEEQGGEVRLNSRAIHLECKDNQIKSLLVNQEGEEVRLPGDSFVSSVPLNELIQLLDPPPPDTALNAAKNLNYRDFILVGLVLDKPQLFPDNWIYVHSPEVKVGRIQNFKNWSPAMVPDANKTSIGMEYFCNRGDEIWEMSDGDLIQLAKKEIQKLGLSKEAAVEDGVVFRQPKAYPVYDRNYQQNVKVIRAYLETIDNLQTIGRNGLHRYNNQDHSMLTAKMAIANLFGENHDLWAVNTEPSYNE